MSEVLSPALRAAIQRAQENRDANPDPRPVTEQLSEKFSELNNMSLCLKASCQNVAVPKHRYCKWHLAVSRVCYLCGRKSKTADEYMTHLGKYHGVTR